MTLKSFAFLQYLDGAYRLPLFYGAVYITLRLVLAERAIYADASHPVCPYEVSLREYVSQLRTAQNALFTEFRCRAERGVKSVNWRSSDTFPTKSDANLTFDRDLVEVERSDLGLDESAPSRSVACVYGDRTWHNLQITSKPFHFKAIALKSIKFFWSFSFKKRTLP